MSSGESRTTTSSRLSQFGLYRSIDARTEEFLRLSRKRQIRQGCACAAVSTAITVTVVVTVFLIYEYNVTTDTNADQKPNKKLNWIGLFNDSAPFDAKYNKATLNLDPTTLKLLPIILKALNHNKYLEKLIEDTSSSPIYERKDTTEFAFKKNVFTDSKNWNKYPGLKTYEVEYKTSPIAYFKSPSSNLDYYTKIRKIRDYQRMLNYFDKMISEKVNFGAAQPVHIVTKTETPLKQTIQAKIQKKPIPEKQKKTKILVNPLDCRKNSLKKLEGCKCSKKLSLLLRKLIANIQEFIPEIMIDKSRCDEKDNNNHPIHTTSKVLNLRSTKLPRLNIISKLSSVTKKLPRTTERFKNIQGSHTTESSKHNPEQNFEPNSSDIGDDSLKLDYMKQFYKKYLVTAITTTKGYLEATKASNKDEATTLPISKNTQNKIRNQIIAQKDEIVEDTTEPYNNQRSMIKPYYRDDDNDYVTLRTKDDKNDLNEMTLNILEHDTDKLSKKNGNKQIYTGNKLHLVWFINNTKTQNLSNLKQSHKSTTLLPKTVVTYVTKSKVITPPTTETKPTSDDKTTLTSPWNTSATNIPKRNFEDEENRPTEDDIQEEESMKQIENLNAHIRPALQYEKDKNFNYSSLQSSPVTIKTTDSSNELLRFEEINPKQWISMLPNNRPIYLEINRNNFKHDTSDEYNANPMDQNIFDLY